MRGKNAPLLEAEAYFTHCPDSSTNPLIQQSINPINPSIPALLLFQRFQMELVQKPVIDRRENHRDTREKRHAAE